MRVRSFVSSLLLFSFVFVSFTGVVLFFAPRLRAAMNEGWSFLFLTRQQYNEIHLGFSLIFLILSVVHLFLNWHSLKNYVASKKNFGFIKKEFVAAFFVSLILFFGIIEKIVPFSNYFSYFYGIKKQEVARGYFYKHKRGFEYKRHISISKPSGM